MAYVVSAKWRARPGEEGARLPCKHLTESGSQKAVRPITCLPGSARR